MKTYIMRHDNTGNRYAVFAESHRAAYILLAEEIGRDIDRYTLETIY